MFYGSGIGLVRQKKAIWLYIFMWVNLLDSSPDHSELSSLALSCQVFVTYSHRLAPAALLIVCSLCKHEDFR